MTKSRRIIIIIPEYGRRDLTEILVRSIPEYLRNGEKVIIFVGNDAHLEAVRPKLPVLYYDYPNNLGFAGHVNRLVKEAVNHFPFMDKKDATDLIIANTDIRFTSESIGILQDFLSEYGGICGPALVMDDGYFAPGTTCGPHHQLFSSKSELPHGCKRMTMVSGACLCLSYWTWKILGGFDAETFKYYFEDDDLGIRANIAGFPVHICYDAVVYHDGCKTMIQGDNSIHSLQMKVSEHNFREKWPKLKWDPTGDYEWRNYTINDLRKVSI